MTTDLDETGGAIRRYPCGADAEDVTCDACPDPDGCIDRVANESGRVMTHARVERTQPPATGVTTIREHFDAQDNRVAIAYMPDCGVGNAVCFDGGGFTNAQALRAFAGDLIDLARRLDPPNSTGAIVPAEDR